MSQNDFEKLKKAVVTHQERVAKDQDLLSRKANQEYQAIEKLRQQRINLDINLLKGSGAIELFEQIQSEGILGQDTVVCTFPTDLPSFFNFRNVMGIEKIDDWYKYIDGCLSIGLDWDYQELTGGDYCDDRTICKSVRVFVKDGKTFLNYSTKSSRDRSEPKLVNENIVELTTNALINAEQR